MADRFPLIVDSSTQRVKELPSGDNIDLTGSGIVADVFTVDTNSSERLRITSSGNIGIDNTSPGNKLSVSKSGAESFDVNPGSVANNNIVLHYNWSGANYVTAETRAAEHVFEIGTSEKMRIDSSGHILMGKTSQNLATAGFQYRSDAPGLVQITRDSGEPLQVNRLTDDGKLIEFRQDTTAIGSISVQGSDLGIDVNGSERMRIDSSGTVNVGSTTVSGTGVHLRPFGNVISRRASGALQVFEGYQGSTLTSEIKADGSAEFAGAITVSDGTSNVYSYLSPGGNVQGARATQSSTASVWEGYGAGSLTSKINSDGSATFGVFPNRLDINAGYLLQYSNQAQANLVLRKTDSLRNSDPVLEVQNNTAAVTSEINADGSATFAGNVTLGSSPDAGAAEGVLIRKNGRIQLGSNQGSTPIWSGYTVGTSDATSQIDADGSAEFAGLITGNGNIVSDRTSGSNTCFQATLNGVTKATINADGSASFSSAAFSSGVLSTRTSGTNAAFAAKTAGASDNAIELNADGSATLAGNVDFGAWNASNNNLEGARIYSNGSIQSNRTSSGGAVLVGRLNGSVTTQITADGAATFAGILESSLLVNTNNTPTTGEGIEMVYDSAASGGAAGTIQAHDRDGAALTRLKIRSSNWEILNDGAATFAGQLSLKR